VIEYITPEDVDALVERLGFHYRDRNLMLSALAAPMPVFGVDVYDGTERKAIVLLQAINRNHPLLDGNKRLSWLVAGAFLELNGWEILADQAEINEFVRAIAADTIFSVDIVLWFENHLRPSV
jgi:death on curing protein